MPNVVRYYSSSTLPVQSSVVVVYGPGASGDHGRGAVTFSKP